MPRIAGVNLPENKRAEIALTYIFGIGRNLSRKILKKAQVDPNQKMKDVPGRELKKIQEVIEKECRTEGDLKREVMLNIKRLKEIGTHRGSRHSKNLPVRGQRTRTNSRTVRGNVRVTMGSGKRSAPEKT